MMRPAAALFALLLAASAHAGEIQTVLAPDSTLYSIGSEEYPRLEVSRRNGDTAEALLVHGTDDAAVESDARLLWDGATSTLFVIWHSASAERDAIVLASLNAGVWSEPVELTTGATFRRVGLQAALTRAAIGEEGSGNATLVHVAWWSMGLEPTPEYALVAFEAGRHVSTEVANLDELAGAHSAADIETEDVGTPLHPPLAIARGGNGVDVVFGSTSSTRMTRVRLEPRKIAGDARIWKPGRSDSGRTQPARLVAADSAPVQAFISKGRIALYEPAAKFRYVVYENGKWTAERMIQLDERVTSDKVLRELRRVVEEEQEPDVDVIEQK
ncbi:MAG TPA: hypothetical protein VE010_05770 [Thermoanaerobaculia bacterium]|nr:hypothetical protein [Thermoanaerobaculia bacterium]